VRKGARQTSCGARQNRRNGPPGRKSRKGSKKSRKGSRKSRKGSRKSRKSRKSMKGGKRHRKGSKKSKKSRISRPAGDSSDEEGGTKGNDDEKKVAEREEEMERREAKSHAVVLEMLGDLPDADVAPAENVLFVCKLNPITTDDDLTLIFSRFDANARATVIRDPITQDSLCYAFVEFSSPQPCTEAYFKMNNVLVDDRRIKVDFSQSVSKEWNRYTQTLRR